MSFCFHLLLLRNPETMVIAVLNGAYDASSLVFRVMLAAKSATGASTGTVLLGALAFPGSVVRMCPCSLARPCAAFRLPWPRHS